MSKCLYNERVDCLLAAELASTKALWHEASGTVRLLKAELADWQRMRNEAMAVAMSNRERIVALEALLRRIVEKPKDPASWCADLVRLAPPAETKGDASA